MTTENLEVEGLTLEEVQQADADFIARKIVAIEQEIGGQLPDQAREDLFNLASQSRSEDGEPQVAQAFNEHIAPKLSAPEEAPEDDDIDWDLIDELAEGGEEPSAPDGHYLAETEEEVGDDLWEDAFEGQTAKLEKREGRELTEKEKDALYDEAAYHYEDLNLAEDFDQLYAGRKAGREGNDDDRQQIAVETMQELEEPQERPDPAEIEDPDDRRRAEMVEDVEAAEDLLTGDDE